MKRISILFAAAIICLCMLFACNDTTSPYVSDTVSEHQSADNSGDTAYSEISESISTDESVVVDIKNGH